MITSYKFTDTQQLLIKPFERLGFVISFILITALSQVVAYFVVYQPAFDILWEQSQMQYGIVAGIIRGINLSTFQPDQRHCLRNNGLVNFF